MQIQKYKGEEHIYARVLLPPIKRESKGKYGRRGKYAIIRVPFDWIGDRVRIINKKRIK